MSIQIYVASGHTHEYFYPLSGTALKWTRNVSEKETLLYQYECEKAFETDIKPAELDNKVSLRG